MTVESSSSKTVFLGNGATTVWTYNFEIDSAAYIVLTYTDASGNVSTLGSAVWLITGIGNPAGGTVTYPLAGDPIAVGTTLTLQRVVPLTQPTDLTNQGGLWPAVVMAMSDNLEYQIQQLAEVVSRAVVVSVSELGPVLPLPPPAVRAGKNATFDSAGNPTASLPASGSVAISTAMTAVVGAASASLADVLLRAPYGEIWLTDFGADPTGTTYCDTAFASFVSAVMTSGRPGFIPPGTFKLQDQATVDFGLAAASAGAAHFRGVLNRSVLDLTAAAGSPSLQLTDLSGNKAAFYGVFKDISVKADVAGVAVAIGLPDHSDAFNGFEIKLQISNASTSASAVGLQINGAYNCDIWVTANNGGHGDGIQCTEMAFCRMFGAAGHSDNGLHLTSFFNFGNVFHALDLEVVNTCVVIDNADCARNTWIGGQMAWSNGSGPPVAAINATAGNGNRFIGQNFASEGLIATGDTGIIVYGSGSAIDTESLGGLAIQPLSGDADVELDAPSGNGAFVVMQSVGVPRWTVGKNNAAESGGNAGSDLLFTRYNDAGAAIDNPLSMNRATGVVAIASASMPVASIVVAQVGNGSDGTIGFFGATPITKPAVTGAKGGNAALTSLLSVLATLGLVTDSTS